MTVRDIADHFKNISNNKIQTETLMMKNSPKRKLKEDHLDSPAKKLRTKTDKKFWESLDGTDKQQESFRVGYFGYQLMIKLVDEEK